MHAVHKGGYADAASASVARRQFYPEIFKRYQRNEQAFVQAMMEMVVQCVPTRKVATITEELCGVEINKSTASRLCDGLDVRLKAFNERRLDGHKFPFVLVDAMYIKARGEDRVQSNAVLIASGFDTKGYRQVLGLSIGESESASTWGEFFILESRQQLNEGKITGFFELNLQHYWDLTRPGVVG